MRTLLSILAWLLLGVHAYAQPVDSFRDEHDVMMYTYREQLPQFRGSVNEYLAKHIRYPADARMNGAAGRVVVSLVITEKGNVDSVRIKESVYPSLDSEAIRVVKLMPRWKPGRAIKADGTVGKPIRVYMDLPISFRLR